MVSVVIPCHNAELWIGETLKSVISQRGVAQEIVIVDDGSTDATVEIATALVSEACNARIARQPHLGVSRARNLGTSLATGAYLQYLDADDVLEDGTLAARVLALEQSGGAVAYCDWQCWEGRPDGSFHTVAVNSRALGDRPDIELLTDAWWPPGAVLYRRDLVGRIGPWNEGLRINQDVQFLLLAASSQARFVRVNHVGLRYRVGARSLSSMNHEVFQIECYKNACDLQQLWTATRRLDNARKEALRRVYRYLARVFANDRQRSDDIHCRLGELDGPPAVAVRDIDGLRELQPELAVLPGAYLADEATSSHR